MKKNVGSADRILRIAAGLIIVTLYLLGELSGTPALLLGIVAFALLTTSAIGVCPFYSLIKVSTRRKE